MTTPSQIVDAAMSLEPSQRAEVAHELLLSLEPDDFDKDADSAWAVEIRRRLQAIRQGRIVLRDWDDALADIRQSLSPKQS
jgi:putative addiction module component